MTEGVRGPLIVAVIRALRKLESEGQIRRITPTGDLDLLSFTAGPNVSSRVKIALLRTQTDPFTVADLVNAGVAEELVGGSWDDQPVSDPDDVLDLTGETPQPYYFTRTPLPPAEQTRRGMLVGLSVSFVAVLLLQLGFALFLDAAAWARVGPLLSTAATLVAAGFGYAWGHYFSGKN